MLPCLPECFRSIYLGYFFPGTKPIWNVTVTLRPGSGYGLIAAALDVGNSRGWADARRQRSYIMDRLFETQLDLRPIEERVPGQRCN